VLRAENIRKRFGATLALDGVSFEAARGEVLALIGENGAGKSTLLNILAGLMAADSGRIQFGDHRIAYIHQELSLFPHLTVAENILVGYEPSRRGVLQWERMRARSKELLEEFGRPEISPEMRVAGLSSANRQVVEICRALAADARLILMDEPTSSLQRSDVDRLFVEIRKLSARGITVLYVSHFLEEIRDVAERAVVLRDGKSVWTGTLDAIGDDELIAHMVGREFTGVSGSKRSHTPGRVLLTVAGLNVRGGEIVGIAGLVGSGRTEFLRTVFAREARAGYLTEDRKTEGIFPHLSVSENLTVTRPVSVAGWIRQEDESLQAERWITRFRIRTSGPSENVRRLSGGNQQKVLLARLLHQDAAILLLDEPTRGIDIGSKAEIYAHIQEAADSGKAVVIVSSYLPELFAICDRLAVMTRGKLSPAAPIERWTPDSVLRAAIGTREPA
jgi:ribose transport system ATP-binding protein